VFAAVNKHAFIVFGIIEYPFMICSPLLSGPQQKKGGARGIFYLVEKINGMELTHTAVAFLVPQFASRWGVEEFRVIESPGFME
jgi:hypothetical protein